MKEKIFSTLLFVVLLVVVLSIAVGTRPSAAAPQGNECATDCFLYLPFLNKPINLDFTVVDLEIFQATQTDSSNVPLVAGKPAVARIYAQTLVGNSPNGVTASLTATREGVVLGTVNATGPTAVPVTPLRGAYNTTFNVVLPDGWLSGQVQLVAKIDAADAVLERDETNNLFGRTIVFNNVPDLRVFLVPINYTHQGPTNPGFYAGQAVDNISDWLLRAYPLGDVQVTMHSAYNFSGNLQNNDGSAWFDLLNDMYALKLSDGYAEQTPIVYYGLIPIQNGSSQWFSSGIAGIGWISPPGQNFREALGLNLGANDNTGILAGHEIGHNLGRRHAPCGNPAGPDGAYPYGGASIGQYGTDIKGNSVSLYTPASHVDMMSYCGPEWISDYTYTGLYNTQRNQGAPAATAVTADRLLIRGNFGPENELLLAPTYALPIQSSSEVGDSDVMVELLDAQGQVAAAYPIAVREAEENGVSFRAVIGTVPLPAVPVASLRLVERGTVLAEREFASNERLAQAAPTFSQTAESVTLNWGLPDVPAIVRYSSDEGVTWTTLSIDVQGGSLTVPRSDLGENGRFEVILSDMNSVAPLTAELTLP